MRAAGMAPRILRNVWFLGERRFVCGAPPQMAPLTW